jgi:hypothetical protein
VGRWRGALAWCAGEVRWEVRWVAGLILASSRRMQEGPTADDGREEPNERRTTMQIDTLSRLVHESRYQIDENEIAEAILARITTPAALTPAFKRPPRRRSVRSFHPARHASSFRLIRQGPRIPATWSA